MEQHLLGKNRSKHDTKRKTRKKRRKSVEMEDLMLKTIKIYVYTIDEKEKGRFAQ